MSLLTRCLNCTLSPAHQAQLHLCLMDKGIFNDRHLSLVCKICKDRCLSFWGEKYCGWARQEFKFGNVLDFAPTSHNYVGNVSASTTFDMETLLKILLHLRIWKRMNSVKLKPCNLSCGGGQGLTSVQILVCHEVLFVCTALIYMLVEPHSHKDGCKLTRVLLLSADLPHVKFIFPTAPQVCLKALLLSILLLRPLNTSM